MPSLWIVDTKVSIAPESSFETDGSDHYYGRSVVPAGNSEQAIESLRAAMKEDHIEILEVREVTNSSSQNWDSELDDFFDTVYSIEIATTTGKLQLGMFASDEVIKEI